MARPSGISILTFDCYGTLVDWETGIRSVLERLRAAYGVAAGVDELLAQWEAIQFRMIGGPWRYYADILRDSLRETFSQHGVALPPEETGALAETIGDWPVFEDVPRVLPRLKACYRLAILSNIDDAMLARSVARMGVEFDALITAEQVRSYKPNKAHFQEAMRRFNAGPERFLHCAFGFKYDQRPALELGIRTVWIKRPGWIRDDVARPTFEVSDLDELARLLGV